MFVNYIFLCLVKFFIGLSVTVMEAQALSQPSSDFKRHSIVRPVMLHGRTKREISTTRHLSGTHHPEVTLKVPVADEEYILDLRLNQDLLPDDYVISYQENNKTVLRNPTVEDIDMCHYGGSVRDRLGSWVAVSTCHGIQGVVFNGESTRYIEPVTRGDTNGEHYLYDHADLMENHPRKWTNVLPNSSRYNPYKQGSVKVKKNALREDIITDTYLENNHSLYVELVLVADKEHYEVHRRNLNSVRTHMKILANIINSVYSQLNIYIVLVGVEVWNNYDKIAFKQNSGYILDNFLKYRRKGLKISNDNAHLVTLYPFDGSVIGKAFSQTICTEEFSAGIAHNHTEVMGLLAMTIAHEMGHNFGMEHDGDCECQDNKCIMSSTSSFTIPEHWSTCSLNALASTFSRGLDICLRNKPKRLFLWPTCGNGMVEEGEDCDCGTMVRKGAFISCHACCDALTCRVRANATCGAGLCCDLQSCRLKSKGAVCRPANSECDLPEHCTGNSKDCHENLYKMDTTPCGTHKESAFCVNGVCRSRSDQCRILWGTTGRSCGSWAYESQYSDCGYDGLTNLHTPCAPRDDMCGRLHCTHLSEQGQPSKVRVGTSRYIKTLSKILHDRLELCYSTSIDLGADVVDFGMVPDGAQCGEGMMCLKQRCVSVVKEREYFSRVHSSVCPSNCSDQGICNSKGDCYCNPGFAPPFCAVIEDSSLSSSTVALLVIFLGIVPAIFLIMLFIYYRCPNALKEYTQKIPRPKFTFSFMNNKPDQDSALYYAKTAHIDVPTLYATVEKITVVNTQIENNIPPELPTKTLNRSKPYLYKFPRDIQPNNEVEKSAIVNIQIENLPVLPIKTLNRPNPYLTKLSRDIQPKVEEASSITKIKPLVNPAANLNIKTEDNRPKIQVLNSGNRMKPLITPKPVLNKPSQEIRTNGQVINTKVIIKRPPPIKPKPNMKNLSEHSGPIYENCKESTSATNVPQNK